MVCCPGLFIAQYYTAPEDSGFGIVNNFIVAEQHFYFLYIIVAEIENISTLTKGALLLISEIVNFFSGSVRHPCHFHQDDPCSDHYV